MFLKEITVITNFFQNYLYRIHVNIKHRKFDMDFILYFLSGRGLVYFIYLKEEDRQNKR